MKYHLKNQFEDGQVDVFLQTSLFRNFHEDFKDKFFSEFPKFLDSALLKIDDPQPLNKYKKPNDIIGRKLLINKCRDIVYAGEMTALRGKKQCGKTLFMRFLYDLEKIKGRRVAWCDFKENSTIPELLEDIRNQLGIKIQPGKDKNCFQTSLKQNVSIFIDNAHFLQTLTWIGKIRPDTSLIFSIEAKGRGFLY